MALSANTLHQLRPIDQGAFNWGWLAQRAPIFILSIESAANIYGYLVMTGTDPVISLIGSFGFDAIFIGLVSLGDQVRELEIDDTGKQIKGKVDWLFWGINLGALLFSFLGALLYHSGGSYAQVTAESLTRAIIFPALSLLYTLYFDRKQKKIKLQAEQVSREYPLSCPYCPKRFKEGEQKKLNGHLAQCDARKQQKAAKP